MLSVFHIFLQTNERPGYIICADRFSIHRLKSNLNQIVLINIYEGIGMLHIFSCYIIENFELDLQKELLPCGLNIHLLTYINMFLYKSFV